MLSPELLQQIRRLQIKTLHLVTEVIAGNYQSTFKGRGMEFEDARVYIPGDDVRHIDWNLTARSGVPHIKNFREERELTINLLIDVSASEIFGTKKRTKNEMAAEVAAILAHTAMRKNDKVGAILFSDQIEYYIPPKKGRSHIWRVIRAILAHQPKSKGTNITQALDFLNKVMHRKSVVFFISDFLDSQFDKALATSKKRHDIIAVTLHDPREEDLPSVGFLEFEDAENGEVSIVDSKDKHLRKEFSHLAKTKREKRDARFRALGIDCIHVETPGSTIDPIVAFFRKRMKKIRR